MNTTMEDIIESNRIKKETWESCRKDLQGILISDQLEKLEDAFYSAAKGYIFRRKEH
ncbi:MAG: hypothetical protein ACLVCT_02960 [Lachnospira sp.]